MSNYSNNDGSGELEVDFDRNVTRLYESISASHWDDALEDIRDHSEESKTWVVRYHDDGQIMWRFLPLHSACARQPPENIVNALLSSYRHGPQCVDDQGMLPLHYACGNQASVDVIRLLLLAYPDGANVADPNGMYPLHYVAQWGPNSIEVIDVMLYANRNALKSRDADGHTPLDLAHEGEYDEADDVVQLLQKYSTPTSSSFIGGGPSSSFGPSSSQLNSGPNTMERNDRQHQTLPIKHASPSEVKTFISMPKTSEAVRRLQEAAAAQQQARQNFLKTFLSFTEQRDEESGGGTLPSPSNFHSSQPNLISPLRSLRIAPSMDDNATAYTMDTSAQQMVSQLKAEVEKLRKEAEQAEIEAQTQINSEREKMQKAIDEMNAKLAACEKETVESLSELTAKEEFGQYVESRLQDKENELETAMKRNENLRNDLDTVKQNITKYKEKTAKLDEHLGALSKSMTGMMEEQEEIMKASARHEEHMKKVSLARQHKMQELIDQEVAFARVSLEKQKQSDLGSEEMINAALESQRKLMAAVAGVLATKG